MSQHASGSESSTGEADVPQRTMLRGRAKGFGHDGRAILARTVERDVIPQLVAMPWIGSAILARAPEPEALPPEQVAPALDSALLLRLVDLCLDTEPGGVGALVSDLQQGGAAADAIYLDLLTPAARRLGELWDEDVCSFAEVTLGLLRLQNAQRMLTPTFMGDSTIAVGAPRVLLLPVPGEQHTFGLSMVLDFFRRAGWDAWLGTVADDKAALALVRRERADLIGLSFACDDRISAAARLIADLRRVSANPGLVVMVGGPSFVADPGLAARVGADATAVDGHQAVLLAHDLIHARASLTP